MKLVTVKEMQQLERAADQAGHSYDAMMEQAGRAVAGLIQERRALAQTDVLILVGPGNNGGDGLVAARYLHEAGARVTVYVAKPRPEDDPNTIRLRQHDVTWTLAEQDDEYATLREACRRADVIVDALLGTGVDRPIHGVLAEILRITRQAVQMRRPSGGPADRVTLGVSRAALDQTAPAHSPLIVAVDVPSGVHCDTGAIDAVSVAADVTVSFGAAKRGHFVFPAAGILGELIVADIGIASEISSEIACEVATHHEIAGRLPARPRDAHKGTFGKAMIVAGSANYVGAAYLASAAAGRVGAGLITLAAPSSLHAILAQKATEPTHLLLPHDVGALVPAAARLLRHYLPGYSSLLVGPGLGNTPDTIEFVHRLLGMSSTPREGQIGFQRRPEPDITKPSLPALVLDADALNALAGQARWWSHLPAGSILTPHPGEMGRLIDADAQQVNADRIGTATRCAARWNHIVVLKGAFTVIASPAGHTTLSPFATPALATAGTGDVLAGAIAGLLAQGLDPFDAALCGVYLHGLAGELATKEIGHAGVLAGDLLPRLPRALWYVNAHR